MARSKPETGSGDPPRFASRPGLQVLWVVERLVADAGDFDRIGLPEVLDDQLAAYLAVRPRQIGKRDVLADARSVGDRSGEGAAAEFVDQRLLRLRVHHRHGADRIAGNAR